MVFGALDWGLGHATRSIPILRYIQQKGGQISIAASGATAELLKNEFPLARMLNLPGYGITYPGQGGSFRGHIMKQIPRIGKAIKAESDWLQEVQKKERFSLVISDNRYGFRLPGVPSVILTHQLAPISGLGKGVDGLFRRTLYHYIDRFSECWVPDLTDEPSLAGQLSHPNPRPRVPVRHIGLLSRLSLGTGRAGPDLLFLLSGPEPQRSVLEQQILDQWERLPGTKTLVRGKPGEKGMPAAPAETRIHNHLPADELATLIASAGTIICRPGYSSLMDLIRLSKRALLIPTPGQTEQEYLAERCEKMGGFKWVPQEGLQLQASLASMPDTTSRYVFPPDAFDQFKKAVDAFVF